MLCVTSAVLRTCSRTAAAATYFSTTAAACKDSRTSHFMKVGRFPRLHYERAGSGDHAVLLLPGALGSTETDFGPQLAKLSREGFTWLALDPPGYGKSQPPEREWPDKFLHEDADTAAQFMDALGYNKYSLVGWSDGGNTAMILAAKYPESVQKMVVWGSNSYVTKEELEMYDSIANIDNWSAKMRQGFIDTYGEEYFRKHWALWIRGVKTYAALDNGNLFKEVLPHIECPTLIVQGDKDAVVPTFHPQFLHKHIRNSKLIQWPNGKHNLHLRYADEFNAEVENFLSS